VDWTVREALAGGAQVIQLREKSLPDRDAMAIAHMVRRATRDADALFVVNDRPDIARLADADGVHVGQEELSVKDARRIVGPHALVGVSTHSIEQARQAVLDGANYIGVGPTFPSSTKSFDVFPGLALIQQVRAEIRLPAFAIGGIDQDRIDDVIAAGARRVAVSSAVCGAEDPRAAAADLRRRLDQPRQLTDSPAGH
jgi:thiamine-phosphate pyrophosphorylase